MKTLAVILHYNTPDLTETLTKLLKQSPEFGVLFDLVVLDNGSDEHLRPTVENIRLDKNYLFGGGLNIAFQLFIENCKDNNYDSLLFLNSDLIVHSHHFVGKLREGLEKFDIISPAIIEPHEGQCFWRQMHCWGSDGFREVKWIDFQSPLFSKKFIDSVTQFPEELVYGWGQDVLSGMICEELGMKVGVCDPMTIVHLGSQTIKRNIDKPEISTFNREAEIRMFNFFKSKEHWDKFHEFRSYGANYNYLQ